MEGRESCERRHDSPLFVFSALRLVDVREIPIEENPQDVAVSYFPRKK
jgi:hypothetical protein